MVVPEGAAMSVPSPSADRNLLFGLLALQMDFLSREQLLEAMLAWMLEKQTPLGEILTRRGVLTEDDRADIERLVEKHVRRHGGEPRASLAAVRVEPDLHASLSALEDDDIQSSLAPATERPTTNSVFLTIPPLPPGEIGPGGAVRYHKLRPHARGGLGEVFVARDEEFQREVALKEIQDRFADRPDARARFLREAEVTGKLEHPGVVPVYGLGVYPDGRPYYAMRFIRGESMEEASRRFHAGRSGLPSRTLGPARQARPTFHSLAFRELLGRFVMVCNAVAYAHSRGVIHRDLKPANAMLGEYGETLVVDWGLARVMDQPASEQTTAERPMQLGSGSGTAPTEMGQVVGTPAYMPPEQAEGQLDCMGVASDVFALGATLYCLLTGQAPYSGPDVLAQARRANVVPARQRNSSVPVGLEAVCQKAMAKQPEDRYATARALADEVQRWLAGEPVLAWPEPLTVKAGRWVRKNRVLSASVAAAVLVALVLGTAGGVYRQQQRQRAREQAAEGLAYAAQLRGGFRYEDAVAMLEQVRGWAAQAADRDLDARLEAAESDLALARDLDGVRQRAATLVEGKWNPYRVRTEYPEVLARHGLDILGGDFDELLETIRTSVVRDSIVAALDDWAFAETDRHRRKRVVQLANGGDEPDPWRHAVREAVARRDAKSLRQLVRETGEGRPTPGVVLLLSGAFGEESKEATALLRQMQRRRPDDFWVSMKLGLRLAAQNQHREAAKCFLIALALRPDNTAAYTSLGVAHHDLGEVEESIACYRRAILIDSSNAVAHNNLGNILREEGELHEAIASCRKAIELDPNFALAHNNLGLALRDKGNLDESIECCKRAIAIDPNFAWPHNNLGLALQDKGKVEEAIACYKKAIALDAKDVLAHNNLGAVLHDKGKVDEAIECFNRALAIDPKNAFALNNLGNALKDKGKVDEAIEYYQKAIASNPKFALAHYNLGRVMADRGKASEAIECYKRAIARDPKYALAHYNLGNVFLEQGKLDESVACYKRAIACNSRHSLAHNNLANALKAKGLIDEALAHYKKAIALDPTNALPLYNLGNVLRDRGMVNEAIVRYREAIACDPKFAKAHNNLGSLLRDKGKVDEAIACFKRAIAIDPRHANAHYNLGRILRDKGHLDQTIEFYKRAVASNPSFALAHYNLGNALRDRGKVDEAIACYKRAIACDPKLTLAHINLGNVLDDTGKVQESIACYKRVLQIEPKNAMAHNNLGNALKDTGKVDEAVECYKRAVTCDPKFALAHYNLGRVMADRGKVEEAIACYKRAITSDPKYSMAYNNLGLVLQDSGKVDEAFDSYKKAIALDPKNAVAHYNLGRIWTERGKVDEAIACYKRAIASNPKYAPAHCNLGMSFHGRNQVKEAIECYKRAIANDPKYAPAHSNLGAAWYGMGKLEESIQCFRKAVASDPTSTPAWQNLGIALGQQGEFTEAHKALRRCLALLPAKHPKRGEVMEQVQKCRQLLAADDKLNAFLAGKGAPADAQMQVQMANLAQQPFHCLNLAAARLYRDALARQPSLAGAHRYDAACAAVQAGTDQGKDARKLDDRQRSAWRKQALDWLAAELAAHRGRAKRAAGRAMVREQLTRWLEDADLAGVRDERSLASLPEKERELWRKVWAEVSALLKKVGQK
jgi:tetratricopeptide (TPR) repeat protein